MSLIIIMNTTIVLTIMYAIIVLFITNVIVSITQFNNLLIKIFNTKLIPYC